MRPRGTANGRAAEEKERRNGKRKGKGEKDGGDKGIGGGIKEGEVEAGRRCVTPPTLTSVTSLGAVCSRLHLRDLREWEPARKARVSWSAVPPPEASLSPSMYRAVARYNPPGPAGASLIRTHF